MTNWLRKNWPFVWRINAYLLLLFLALPLNIGGMTLMLFGINSGIYAVFVKPPKLKFISLPTLLFVGYFLLLALLIPFSSDVGAAAFDWQKKLGLIVFPLCFLLGQGEFSTHFKNRMLRGFAWVNVLFAAYVLMRILIFGVNTYYLPAGYSVAMRTTIQDFTGVHPTYLSLVFGFCILLFLNFIDFKSWRKLTFWVAAAGILVLALTMLTLAARMPLIAMAVASLAILYHRFRWRGIGAWISLVVLLLAGIMINPVTRYRTLELILSAQKSAAEIEQTTTNVRTAIYHCGWETIRENWLVGVGAGDIQPALNNCYDQFENDELERSQFNTHNEYFNTWLSSGIFGLLLFLAALVTAFFTFKRNGLAVAFLIFISICFLSENILSRQTGVFFVGFLWTILMLFETSKNGAFLIEAEKPQ